MILIVFLDSTKIETRRLKNNIIFFQTMILQIELLSPVLFILFNIHASKCFKIIKKRFHWKLGMKNQLSFKLLPKKSLRYMRQYNLARFPIELE